MCFYKPSSQRVGGKFKTSRSDESDKSNKRPKGSKSGEETGANTTNSAVGSVKVSKCSAVEAKNAEEWVLRILDTPVIALGRQFVGLAKWKPEGMTIEAHTVNRPLNRYADVFCQDNKRVVLKFPGLSTDYINANYVGTVNNDKRFICTQGPLEQTMFSFWAMVIQEKSDFIIMLCNYVEMDKQKCFPYFPTDEEEERVYGDEENKITVHCEKVKPLSTEDNFVKVRRMNIKWREGTRAVLHYHWENWPDRGVPASNMTALNLLSVVRSTETPIIVHCSAGIGRTGTIVAVEYVIEKMQKGECCQAMDEILKEIRTQRAFSIQNEYQYVYLHRVLLAYFLEKNSSRYPNLATKEVQAKYKTWCENYEKAVGAVQERKAG